MDEKCVGYEKEQVTAEFMAALERQEIRAYYQPQFDALTKKLTGAEALVRWIRPDGTVVMPGVFIPALEETDDILALDWYMLREICAFLREQRLSGEEQVPVSVNFSRRHVREERFVEQLCAVVDEYGVAHSMVIVEITESAFAVHPERVAELVGKIRGAGFCVAVDDFGSGLSCLSIVKDISIDILKIDKSLLSRNCEDEKERIVLESIFLFAHRLNMTTVAEGVETKEQLEFLRTCDCRIIQGFLFAKPMPAEDYRKLCAEEFLKEKAEEDILLIQAPSSATQLLLQAVFMCYPLVIFANLTRNSFYMMAYENFSARSCPSTGVYEELIGHGAATMHPDDSEIFRNTFRIANQMEMYERGERTLRLVTRQKGDDGVYRHVETTNYFVRHPASEDVLVITLCHNLDD